MKFASSSSRPQTPKPGIEPVLQATALIVLFASWIAFSLGFRKPLNQASAPNTVARATSSRLGIALVGVAYFFAWVYVRPPKFQKWSAALIASMILGPFSAALACAATRHLGKQWRYEAAIREDHELIQTGPYAWVRHPIYSSMFGMLLATGLAWTWWPMLTAAVIFFVAGTEIRIRAEERLLAERFGDAFTAYRARVPAWLPPIR